MQGNKKRLYEKKYQYLILCPLLIVFWLIPLFGKNLSLDGEFLKAAAVYAGFLAAVLLCRLLQNRHVALLSAAAVGAGLCVLRSTALYDLCPALLLCCWLRCYREQVKGNPVNLYFELFTDLIYASVAAAAVRLFRSGYALVDLRSTVFTPIPDLCLMVLLLLLSLVFFIFGAKEKGQSVPPEKKRKTGARRADRQIAGVLPVYLTLRTFWGFCALLLGVSLIQYTNAKLIVESTLYYSVGFRFLFFPWMVLLFLVLDAFLPRSAVLNRLFR